MEGEYTYIGHDDEVFDDEWYFVGEDDEEEDQNNNDKDNNGGGFGSLFPNIDRDSSVTCLVRCSRSDYDALSAVNRSFRALIKSGELYPLRRMKGIAEHWVCFSCSLGEEWDVFDPESRSWRQLPPMGSNEIFMCADKESLGVGTDLLVVGREMFSPVIYRYSVVTDAWSSARPMTETRWLFGSASLGEIGIVAGGCNAVGDIVNTAELYNSDTGSWTPLPRMNRARKMCSAVFMDGKFYVVGGLGPSAGRKNNRLLTCGEEYDLEAGTWRVIPYMSPLSNIGNRGRTIESGAPPLIAVVDEQLYAADHRSMVLKKYEKGTGEWVSIGWLPRSTCSVNGWGMAFRACGKRLIVISGPRTNTGTGLIEINAWAPSDGPRVKWTLLGRKFSNNFVYNCAIMGC
ncbi:unnamed protein product [Cuscuta campestris]|uniref:F-box domain-containing protein n=1 Tax=Cuscuta campestris TaxID=132261 RepID=A0A484KM62_9ASTE|nr:unnamed protein product [Cuscuta campestris]